MDDAEKLEEKKDKVTWASIFDDFLNQPPTSSLFRLYLLCFLIWNKKVILYLAFHDSSMIDKLHNLHEFVPFSYMLSSLGTEISFYFGPLIITVIIYSISLYKVFPSPELKVSKIVSKDKKWFTGLPVVSLEKPNAVGSRYSLYNYFYKKHSDEQKQRNVLKVQLLDEITAVEKKEAEVIIKKQENLLKERELRELQDVQIKNREKYWKQEFDDFKINKSLCQQFYLLGRVIINSEPDNVFTDTNFHYILGGYAISHTIFDLLRNKGLLDFVQEEKSSSNYFVSLTPKGMSFYLFMEMDIGVEKRDSGFYEFQSDKILYDFFSIFLKNIDEREHVELDVDKTTGNFFLSNISYNQSLLEKMEDKYALIYRHTLDVSPSSLGKTKQSVSLSPKGKRFRELISQE